MTPLHIAIVLQISGALDIAVGLVLMLLTPSTGLSQGAVILSVGVFSGMLGRLWLTMLQRRDRDATLYAARMAQFGRNPADTRGPGITRVSPVRALPATEPVKGSVSQAHVPAGRSVERFTEHTMSVLPRKDRPLGLPKAPALETLGDPFSDEPEAAREVQEIGHSLEPTPIQSMPQKPVQAEVRKA